MTKPRRTFQGSLVAMVTPFRDGQVDEAKLRELVEFHVTHGTDGLVPCGTTGESPTLSHAEHKRVIEIVIEAAAGRIPVVAGTGSNSTAEAIDMTVHAARAGADAALLVSPYYNKPTQEGLYRHFRAIAEAAPDLPMIPYNIQGRTAVNVETETMARPMVAAYPRGMAAGDDARAKIQRLLVTGDNRLKQGVAAEKVRESYEQALEAAREAGLEDAVRPLVEIRLADLDARGSA